MKSLKFKNNKTNSILFALCLTGFIACGGGNKALISQAEIDSAQQSGTLQSLYDKASGFVTESRGSSKKEAIALQSKIADLLVAGKAKLVNELLNRENQSENPVTRAELLDAQKSIEPMQNWSATDYARINSQLQNRIKNADSTISAAMADAEAKKNDTVGYVLAIKQAAKYAGEGQAEYTQFKNEYDKAVKQYLYQGNDALNKRLYSTAMRSAKSGLALDQGNVQFESMLSQSQAGLFDKDFRFALENGKPESAYQSLINVADEPIFLQIKKSMGSNIQLLANYFAGAAQKEYQKGNLKDAYYHLIKGRTIQEKLGIAQKGFIQEKRFLDLVMTRAKNAQSGIGKRQALLRVINEFDPNYPGLKADYLKLSDEVKNRAMTKLSVAEFKEVQSADSVVTSVGRRVGSKLEKILFDKLGNEVLIVTETNGQGGSGYQGLALQIDGEILQAAIESNVNNGQRSINVRTGVNRVETEEYKKWAKRERGEAPTQYHESPKMEDVVLTVQHIRKQAIAEVAFRIIEPASGKILLTDNFVKDGEYSGESINEYQKGEFHQPYVRADLPSDIKIMDELASALAEMLGQKLGDYLQNPEQVFHHKFVESKAQGNQPGAIELLSNAVIIAESKERETGNWYAELVDMALQ
ncbi:MAG: hypothetical protein OQJ89_01595 [Kangiellaceae bacterium]|nr:hypothetical protein [Kangiellaceae bacterium]MCW9015637.1 hypothetical protein [Kangiellaceae bacterium]